MSVQPTAKMKRRLNIVVILVLVIFTVCITINLFNTSVLNSDYYQNLANQQQFASLTLNANRGSIYDKNGQILAQSATVFTIFIAPADIKNNEPKKRELIAEGLAEILNLDKDEVLEKTYKNNLYEEIARKIEKPLADEVMAFAVKNNIKSIYRREDTKRYYPQNDLAAPVIGFTNYDGDGAYGIEAFYDEYLQGVDGRIISAKDALGAEMPYRYEKIYDAQDGNSLYLTIDSTLQYYTEKYLAQTVAEKKVEQRACAIMMNAKTGAILAMATEPDFDLNEPSIIFDKTTADALALLDGDEYTQAYIKAREQQWKNKAITELYYPGSVFKVVTGSAAYEEKLIDKNTTFHCGYSFNVAGTTMHCWKAGGHGTQNFVEAMTHSCNPAFVNIGQRLGSTLFFSYFKSYGFKDKTGIDLPGEVKGFTISEDMLGPVQLASSSFGQTNKITPIQMITAYAAVVNGGNLVTPYVVDRILDSNGNVLQQNTAQIKRQVISEETSKIMRETLESVVNTNGGSNSYIKGYRIGGKSGTSQKQDQDNETGGEDYVSSYCGFFPANDPEIIMLVMVDQPTNGEYYGSLVAAPVVTNVFKEALPYLGYYPEYTQDEIEQMEVIMPSVEAQKIDNSKKTLEALGLNVKVVGSGENVVKQIPAKSNTVPKGGTVYLYTEENSNVTEVRVPNVVGMKLSDVNTALTNAGLNALITGGSAHNSGAISIKQNYAEGEYVPKGTVVEVTFAVKDETG